MHSFWIAAGSAFWLGILTSISPCPLATNITAMSFIARRMERIRGVWFSGLLYTAGRMATYIILAILLVNGILSIPGASFALQRYMNTALGPVLILTGVLLLGWISLPMPDRGITTTARERAGNWGAIGAGLLGILFALSFCPVSAALFFGGLVPLSLKAGSRLWIPAIYGIGTGLPVVIFAVLLAVGAHSIGTLFNRIQIAEKWIRLITGGIFILAGIYYTLIYIIHFEM